MTFEVDNDALKKAMMRHYETKLNRELREMFIFSQNPDMAEIWKIYMEEIRAKQLREASRKDEAMDGGDMFMIVIGIGMAIYGIHHLLTTTPT